jgi:hypothetical protein
MWAQVNPGAVANHKGFAQFSNAASWPLTQCDHEPFI